MRIFRCTAVLFFMIVLPSIVGADVGSVSDLFAKAADAAAENTILAINDWIAADPEIKVPIDVAVWAVENDRNDIVRNRLMDVFSQNLHIKVRASIRTKEFEAYKDHIPDKLKWKFLFDPGTPVELQQLQEARYMIDCKVESYGEKGQKAEMVLVTKVADYLKGGIVTKTARGSVSKFQTVDWVWRAGVAAFSAVCCLVFVFWANWQSIRFWYFWAMLAAMESGVFWFLIGRHL